MIAAQVPSILAHGYAVHSCIHYLCRLLRLLLGRHAVAAVHSRQITVTREPAHAPLHYKCVCAAIPAGWQPDNLGQGSVVHGRGQAQEAGGDGTGGGAGQEASSSKATTSSSSSKQGQQPCTFSASICKWILPACQPLAPTSCMLCYIAGLAYKLNKSGPPWVLRHGLCMLGYA